MRNLDASKEQEQIEEGMWLHRMNYLGTGKGSQETHTAATSDGKNTEDYWDTHSITLESHWRGKREDP